MNPFTLSQYQHTYLGSFPNKYKVYLNNSHNQLLFDSLDSIGFFDFYPDNNKHIVSHHCIIAFLFCGGKLALHNGFNAPKQQINVHHLDGNTFNNSASNLVYVTTDAHSHITRHQRSANKYLKVHKKGYLYFDNQIIWNRKGTLIHNFKKWLANLILKTVVLTAIHNSISIDIKSISKWFKKLRQYLNLSFSNSLFLPTFFLLTDSLSSTI